jgi:hypothetical protein
MHPLRYGLASIAARPRVLHGYLSLLTDIVGGTDDVISLRGRRDDLQKTLAAVYKGAPHTDGKAYREAHIALKQNEEYTFSDPEVDAFLPTQLRKSTRTQD